MSSDGARVAEAMKQTNNVTIGHYIMGKALGKGTFGQVKQGTHILTGEKVSKVKN